MSSGFHFEPIGHRAHCKAGLTVLEIAHRAGVPLAAVCGGKGTCGQWKVQDTVWGKYLPLSDVEQRLLTRPEIADGFRLACQTVALSPLKVHVPARSLTSTQRIQVESLEVEVVPASAINTYPLDLAPPSQSDLRSDSVRAVDALEQEYDLGRVDMDVAVSRLLPDRLRETH